MQPTYFFRECVTEELRSTLLKRRYELQKEFTVLSPPQIPDDFYLPFTKILGEDVYAHVIFSHSNIPQEQQQSFDVLLLRYDKDEPWESLATPIPGRAITNITGYLPGPTTDPLPLIRERHLARQEWKFYSKSDLYMQLQVVRQRLEDVVLDWLESPESTQFIRVEKSWYREPFRNYLSGTWDASTAHTAIQHFERPGFGISAGNVDETYLVNEVIRILYQLQLPNPIKRPDQDLLNYLMECLEGQQHFSITQYKEMRAALREAKKRMR